MTPTPTYSQATFQTIETTATVDENGVLTVPALRGVRAGEVRVFVLVSPLQTKPTSGDTSEEITEAEWHRSLTTNPAFDFLKDPAEDIYSWEDGEPLPPLRRSEGA